MASDTNVQLNFDYEPVISDDYMEVIGMDSNFMGKKEFGRDRGNNIIIYVIIFPIF